MGYQIDEKYSKKNFAVYTENKNYHKEEFTNLNGKWRSTLTNGRSGWLFLFEHLDQVKKFIESLESNTSKTASPLTNIKNSAKSRKGQNVYRRAVSEDELEENKDEGNQEQGEGEEQEEEEEGEGEEQEGDEEGDEEEEEGEEEGEGDEEEQEEEEEGEEEEDEEEEGEEEEEEEEEEVKPQVVSRLKKKDVFDSSSEEEILVKKAPLSSISKENDVKKKVQPTSKNNITSKAPIKNKVPTPVKNKVTVQSHVPVKKNISTSFSQKNLSQSSYSVKNNVTPHRRVSKKYVEKSSSSDESSSSDDYVKKRKIEREMRNRKPEKSENKYSDNKYNKYVNLAKRKPVVLSDSSTEEESSSDDFPSPSPVRRDEYSNIVRKMRELEKKLKKHK